MVRVLQGVIDVFWGMASWGVIIVDFISKSFGGYGCMRVLETLLLVLRERRADFLLPEASL